MAKRFQWHQFWFGTEHRLIEIEGHTESVVGTVVLTDGPSVTYQTSLTGEEVFASLAEAQEAVEKLLGVKEIDTIREVKL